MVVNKWQLLCFTPFYLSGAIILHLCVGLLGNKAQTILVQLDQDCFIFYSNGIKWLCGCHLWASYPLCIVFLFSPEVWELQHFFGAARAPPSLNWLVDWIVFWNLEDAKTKLQNQLNADARILFAINYMQQKIGFRNLLLSQKWLQNCLWTALFGASRCSSPC